MIFLKILNMGIAASWLIAAVFLPFILMIFMILSALHCALVELLCFCLNYTLKA